jgi:ribose/xylose/arabinose/galactoside ABC-type transport system permease subunit
MIEYGTLTSKASEIFYDLFWHLQGLWNSFPMPAWIAIGVFAVVFYLLIRNWLGWDK